MKYQLLLFFLFLTGLISLFAQEDYVKHKVVKGEIVTEIAQKYKVTPNDLYTLNPKLRDGIFENEIILIPKSKVTKTTQENTSTPKLSNQSASSSGGVIIHIVQPRETKYGLAKRYGITVEELEQQNPHTISVLQINHRLEIRGGKDSGGFVLNVQPSPTNTTTGKVISYVVQPKETLYGISRRYGITVGDLIAANRSVAGDLIKIGQILNIPVVGDAITYQQSNTNVGTSIHVVEAGETKYGLSKQYGITIEELEKNNPHIVTMLQVGHKVVVSNLGSSPVGVQKPEIVEVPVQNEKTQVVPETKTQGILQSNTNETESGFVAYEVQPKETIYGLSRMAGISQEKLLELNPQIVDGVKIGMIIKLPSNPSTATLETKSVNAKIQKTGLLATLNTLENKEVAFLLPINEMTLKAIVSDPLQSSMALDEKAIRNKDFYLGAQFAVDSIKKLGVQVEAKLYSVTQNTALNVAKNNNLATSSLVFYPVEDSKSDNIAEYLSKNNVPFLSYHTDETKRTPNNFQLLPKEIELKRAVLKYLSDLGGTIIIVSDSEKQKSEQWIKQNFSNVLFVKTDDKGILNVESVKRLLTKNSKNFVVMDTDKTGILLDATTILMKESTNYTIQLVLMDEITSLNEESLSEMRFKVLKMIYPSVTKLDNLSALNTFNKQFRKQYKTDPSPESIKGFDVTFDALVRVFQNKNFEATAKDNETQQVMYRFKYNKNGNGGYSNLGVYLYQFDAETNVKPVN
ncbi:LysM peptidoglycan-binding domain-containing protein [Flavobacterium sp. UBA6135]|uniref:LysM peptidoglycan-binding domain-containing protein n=1 Tax=Flavobacterium sp. UBA6135 TaxID=1946553 RepID=UPI0025C42FCE|nr:LysM peptidoglycan-binding domain-containing protein [Flavobacterium sp. UBA6135]